MPPVQYRLTCCLLLTTLSLTALLCGCKTTLPKDPGVEIHQIVTGKLGSAYDSIPNSTGAYMLYVQKTATPNNHVKFLVIQIASQKVVTEQSFNPGYAKWITDSSIEVLSVPGMIRENESLSDYKKIINIDPQKK
jgi:hypothetical protein